MLKKDYFKQLLVDPLHQGKGTGFARTSQCNHQNLIPSSLTLEKPSPSRSLKKSELTSPVN